MAHVYWAGGKRHGGKRSRGSANKAPFVAAVALNKRGHPLAMNMTVVKGFWLTESARWPTQYLQHGSTVISDGLPCFSAATAAGYTHAAGSRAVGHKKS